MSSWLVTLALCVLVAAAQSLDAQKSTTNDEPGNPTLSRYNINYARQGPTTLLTTSSTYDYWWPYPPAGTYTSTPVPAPYSTTTTVPTSIPPTSTGDDVASSSDMNTANSPSVIHITALPPATTTFSAHPYSKLKPASSARIQLAYLVPLFALLGILLGSISAWFIYARYIRRRATHVSFEPGPVYIPTEKDEDPERASLTDHADIDVGGSPSKYSRHGSMYSRSTSGSIWLARALSKQAQPAPSTVKFKWPAAPVDVEDDPFLVRGPSCAKTHASSPAGRVTSPDGFSLLDYIFGEGRDVESEESEELYASVRHTSIRRGILDRLKFGASSPAHEARGTAQTNIKRPERSYTRAGSPLKTRETIRSNSVDDSEWVAGSGFRIVKEDPEKLPKSIWATAQGSPTKGSWWKSSVEEEDKYTPLPVRKSPSKGRSPHRTPTSPSRSTRVLDTSVLPSSPPRVTSPPLESQLFFTPILQSSMPSTDSKRKPQVSKIPQRPLLEGRKAKKLRSPTIPSPLPSTTHNSPYRTLKKSHTTEDATLSTVRRNGDPSVRASASRQITSNRTTASRGTPAERHAARLGALSRVEEIVSQSKSNR